MLIPLMNKVGKAGLEMDFFYKEGKPHCNLLRDWNEDWLGSGKTYYHALKESLSKAGMEHLISEVAKELGRSGNRTKKQKAASVENGKKGGRPKGSKDSQLRVKGGK